ncbi:MAG: LPS assembly lipoprotein LptE [Hyphomicrobiales bacterium]
MSDQAETIMLATSKSVNRRVLLGILGAGALALSGCQVSPLYGDRAGPGGTSATANILASISVDPPSDRTTQLVRNELLFGLDSGTQNAQYRLALHASQGETGLGITRTGSTSARSVRVTATYQLFELGDDEILATNTVFATASYDAVEQRFSNQRAAIDAEARAAREVAATIQAQLAAAIATGN